MDSPFTAARYHSLVIEEETFPHDALEATAWTEDGLIMAARHKKYKHIQVFLLPSASRTGTPVDASAGPSSQVEDVYLELYTCGCYVLTLTISGRPIPPGEHHHPRGQENHPQLLQIH